MEDKGEPGLDELYKDSFWALRSRLFILEQECKGERRIGIAYRRHNIEAMRRELDTLAEILSEEERLCTM